MIPQEGGVSSPLAPLSIPGGALPPWDFWVKVKIRCFGRIKELALIIKGVFSPLKSVDENFQNLP